MAAISRAWCDGSYTMAAKLLAIKTMEIHNPMIQFLMMRL